MKATPEMIAAGAKAARKYMEETGGNSPAVIWDAMWAAKPAQQQEPDCPKCRNNRQVWDNQITGKKTCHRVGCHQEIEQPAQQEPLTDHDDRRKMIADARAALKSVTEQLRHGDTLGASLVLHPVEKVLDALSVAQQPAQQEPSVPAAAFDRLSALNESNAARIIELQDRIDAMMPLTDDQAKGIAGEAAMWGEIWEKDFMQAAVALIRKTEACLAKGDA